MEKIENTKSSGWQINNFSLKILALIIAVIIWLVLSITEYPTISKTITNVPVSFSMDGTSAEEKGLQALGYKEITVDVEIKGMNYEIGSYSSNDLTASVNVSNVSKEGTYSLDIDVKSAHSADRVDVVSVYPSTVDVTFVRIDNSTFDVTASAPNVKAEQGKTLKDVSVSPSSVTLEGSSSNLKKISKIEAKYEDEQTLSEDSTFSTSTLIFYDENGNTLDGSKYKILDAEKFEIKFVVYKKKTVDLTVDFTDCPPGFKASTIPYVLSEDQLNIITPNLEDTDKQTLSIGSIPLKDISTTKTFDFDVNNKLSSGEINQSGVDKITVSFDFSFYTSRTYTIPGSSIRIMNAPANTSVVIDTKQIPSVVMFGPVNSINNLNASGLTVVLDLSDISTTGSITHDVMIYSTAFDNVWCVGDQKVQLEIKPKTEDSSSESSSE